MSNELASARGRKIPSRPRLSSSGLPLDEFSHLLLLAHRVAAEPQRTDELLGAVIRAVDARHGSITICDTTGRHVHFLHFHPYRAELAREYQQAWGRDDPLRRAILAAEPGRFLMRDLLVDQGGA